MFPRKGGQWSRESVKPSLRSKRKWSARPDSNRRDLRGRKEGYRYLTSALKLVETEVIETSCCPLCERGDHAKQSQSPRMEHATGFEPVGSCFADSRFRQATSTCMENLTNGRGASHSPRGACISRGACGLNRTAAKPAHHCDATPVSCARNSRLGEGAGIEPATPGVWARCSIR